MRGNHRSLGRKLQAPAPGLQKGGGGCGTRGCQETAASTCKEVLRTRGKGMIQRGTAMGIKRTERCVIIKKGS